MKKNLRYVNAVLFLLSLGVAFMDLVKLVIYRLSMIDLVKVGMGKSSYDLLELASLNSYVKDMLKVFTILAAVLAVAAILGALLASVLPPKGAYVISMLMSVIDLACLGCIFFGIASQMMDVEEMLAGFTMSLDSQAVLQLYKAPLIIGIVVYVGIFVLSCVGLACKSRETEQEEMEEILIETFSPVKNPWREEPAAPVRPAAPVSPVVQEPSSVRSIHSAAAPVKPAGAVKAAEQNARTFNGAVIGKNDGFAGLAYPMEEKQQVFFAAGREGIHIVKEQQDGAVAGVYYISEYEEYCMNVYEKKTCFLASGQPLGKGREYYLPRGTEVYIGEGETAFELA